MQHDSYSNAYILSILQSVRTIAMVGASAKWNRPSHFAMKYLQEKGYRVIPVNPGQAGGEILGERVYASLAEIPERFEMVDIFRASEAAGGVVDEALSLQQDKGIEVIWMQLGVRDDAAAARAEAAGMKVVMDRCPKIEFGRLNAELAWGGFDTKVITAKRRRVRLA
ncbi:CoA-binding protein [Aquibaculum sediminis]|uniref:CoA-binding protein n=1 Tax=Aquibaculum sediminis TaxID=3231907 RepID=UPI0034519940